MNAVVVLGTDGTTDAQAGCGYVRNPITVADLSKCLSAVFAVFQMLHRVFSEAIVGTFFETYYRGQGVGVIKSSSVTEFRGNGTVNSVVLRDERTISCDLVVAGIGVQPAIEVVTNSGLDLGDGILVNEYLQASQPDKFAAGDVANYWDVIFGRRRRVEHWDNAVSQGQYCARSSMGERTPFKHVPYFFSDIFDLSYEYWGDSSGADKVVHRGDLSSSSFSV